MSSPIASGKDRSAATVAAALKKVPPFPPVAAKLLAMLSASTVETNEVAELISSDATFTARLLQRVNSIEFGLAYPVTNVRQAVVLLGLGLTRQVTVMHAAGAYAEASLRTEQLRRCWQHTVATAVLAEEIAKACGVFVDVAFTAGILHDIGRLGLLVAYPSEYERVMQDAAARCLDLLDFEQETFGLNHAEAGRMLAERWGLPKEMCLIAGRHHDPVEGAELGLLGIVHAACRLADVLGFDVVKPLVPSQVDEVLAELPDGARQRFRKSPTELCALIEKRMLEYNPHQTVPPTEESLAMLASAVAADGETTPVVPAIPPPIPPQSSLTFSIMRGVLFGLIALTVLLLWKMC